jgi:hypothetical protein
MKNWKEGRKLVDVICANCQKTFKKTESEYNRSEKNNKKHFCSLKCSHDLRKFEIIIHCKFCDKEISSNDKNKLFCSQSCSASYNNQNRTCKERVYSEQGMKNILDANNKRYGTTKKFVEYDINPNHCKECNNSLSHKKRNHIFCSIDCKRIYDRKNLTEYQKYYKECQFKFGLSDYPNEFDFNLIKKHGWYQAKNHGDNLNGISRDHMISVKYGYENNISPEIIKHPANCKLMIHNENSSKWKACSITLKELNDKINNWNLNTIMPH